MHLRVGPLPFQQQRVHPLRGRFVPSHFYFYPIGYYCPNDDAEYSCATGYYSFGGASSCTQCSAGFYCSTTTSLPVRCSTGTYSNAGATSCSTCEAGYACVDGTRTACTSGSNYQSATGQVYCDTCPVGYYCASTTTATACSVKYYSNGAAASCTALDTYYYVNGQQIERECPSGFYLDSSKTACTICPAGSYCANPSTVTTCSGANVCPQGTTAMISVSSSGLVITSGQYTIGYTQSCQTGYVSSTAYVCTACAAGYYCTDPTTSTATTCAAGTYNTAGQMMFCYNCDPGYTCAGSASAEVAVSSGSYTTDSQ